MFDVSRTTLLVLAVAAIVLLFVSLALGFFPGWILAILLGIYVVVGLVRQRGGPRPA